MGQKSNPIGLRLEKTNQYWNFCWYGDYNYTEQLMEDCKISAHIQNMCKQAKKASPVILLTRSRGEMQIALFFPRQRRPISKARFKNKQLVQVEKGKLSSKMGDWLSKIYNGYKENSLPLFHPSQRRKDRVGGELGGMYAVPTPVRGQNMEKLVSLSFTQKKELRREIYSNYLYSILLAKPGEIPLELVSWHKKNINWEKLQTKSANVLVSASKTLLGRDFRATLLQQDPNFLSRWKEVGRPGLFPESGHRHVWGGLNENSTNAAVQSKTYRDSIQQIVVGALQLGDKGPSPSSTKKAPPFFFSSSGEKNKIFTSKKEKSTGNMPVLRDEMGGNRMGLHKGAPWGQFQRERSASFLLHLAEKHTNSLFRLTQSKRARPRFATPIFSNLEESIYEELHYRCKILLFSCSSPQQNPLFLAAQVVFSLEERVPFRRFKHRLIREISKNSMIKGVRITCSGRVAARSKKAQKAKIESIQWGETSLHVFSEFVHFASKSALTSFGKVGVKVWVCYQGDLI